MIESKKRDQLVGPVAVCDHCGEEITDATQGSCVWQESLDSERRIIGTFYFVHYDCDTDFERLRADKDKTWCSTELDVWLAYLNNNVKWNREKAREKAALMANLGI
jgi:hypothetical protein